MNTFNAEYAHNLAVLHGTTVIGKVLSMGLQKASCLSLFTTYTLGQAGNTLSIQLECQDPVNLNWIPFGAPLVLSVAGNAINTLTLPPGVASSRLKFTCAGANTDTIELVMSGLPQGFSIT